MDFSKHQSCMCFLWKDAHRCFSPQTTSITEEITIPLEPRLGMSLLGLITDYELPMGAWVTS